MIRHIKKLSELNLDRHFENREVLIMVKTGIHDWFGYRIDNEERFKLIREAGFNSVLFGGEMNMQIM